MLPGDQWRGGELTNVNSDVTEAGNAALSLVTLLRAVGEQMLARREGEGEGKMERIKNVKLAG